MSINCRIELKGYLGQDPKIHTSEKAKEFVILNIATTDTYREKSGDWKSKETIWHEVLFFRPGAISFARNMKKGDRVYIDGTLSYKEELSKAGHKIKLATIIGNYIAAAPLPVKGDEEETNE